MELIGNSPHGDGVHPVGTEFAPLATEFIPWGQNSPCGDGINPMGTEFILLGWSFSHGHGIHAPGGRVHPVGQQGETTLPQSQPGIWISTISKEIGTTLSLTSFFCFLGVFCFFVCLEFFWLVCLDGFLFICFGCCFWYFGRKFPLSQPGQAQGGEEVVVVDIPNPWLLCSPFPGLPSSCTWNFTPSWRIFPQSQGSVPSMATAPNSQMPPSCRATPSVPLSPCHLSWLCGMDPMDNWDGRALDTSFLVETTQNFCCSGAAQAAGWEWREQIPHTGHEGGQG